MAEVVNVVENVDLLFSEIEVNGETYTSDRYVAAETTQSTSSSSASTQDSTESQDASTQASQGADVYAVELNDVLHDFVDRAVRDSLSSEVTSRENADAQLREDIATAIGGLDVPSAGGSGKYIKSISEEDGKIDAIEESLDLSPSNESTNAISGGAVYNYAHGTAYLNTGASASAKTAIMLDYPLQAGERFPITVANSNTYAGALTLNVNSTGAKSLYINGSASSASNYSLPAGTFSCTYNGTYYNIDTDGGLTASGPIRGTLFQTDVYKAGVRFKKPDNYAWPSYLLMYDITTWMNATSDSMPAMSTKGFCGLISAYRDNGFITASDCAEIMVLVGYRRYSTTAPNNNRFLVKNESSKHLPSIIYNSTTDKYWLALKCISNDNRVFLTGIFSGGDFDGTWVNTTDSSGTLPSPWSEWWSEVTPSSYTKLIPFDTNNYIEGKTDGTEKWVHIHLNGLKYYTNITFGESIGTLPDTYKPTHTVRGFFNMDYDSGSLSCVICIDAGGNVTLYPIMPSQTSGTVYSKGIYGDGYYLIQ